MSDGCTSDSTKTPLHGRDELLQEFDKLELQELSEDLGDDPKDDSPDCDLPVLSDLIDDLASKVANRHIVGVIVLDASNLEGWERQYGSTAFDAVMAHLSDMASDMRGESFRVDEILCRNAEGGDTILIFLDAPRGDTQLQPRIDFENIIERMRTRLSTPYTGQRLWVHEALEQIAIGRALIVHNNSVSPRREIHRALRRAKSDAEVNFRDMERRQNRIVGEIITSKNIETLYQPVVELQDGSVTGFEALSRPASNLSQELRAHLFVAASQAELDGELDQTCRQLSMEKHPPLKDRGKLFINCLPPTFYRPLDRLNELLDNWKQKGFSADQLVLEITENMTQDQVKRIIPAISELKNRGVHFALDDMGTGITNLRLLADLKPDFIKMDISLTQDIDESPRKQRLASYLLELGEGSNAKVIAEGVERVDEHETLLDLGFQYGQGFLFGRPNANDEVSAVSDH